MKDFVTLPAEDYRELSETAWGQTTTIGDRIAGTVQTTIVCTVLAGAVAGGTWGWAKAIDWLEERRDMRRNRDFNRARSARS